MKLFNLKKSIPFLLILLIIVLLNLFNQKQTTKIKILIWNTPLLSLGNYIAISTGTGFILSFIVTNSLAKRYQSIQKNTIRYKSDNQEQNSNLDYDLNNKINYDNTLIERDIKDPSPTMNACFRVIGKTEKKRVSTENILINENDTSGLSEKSNYKYYKQEVNYNKDTKNTRITNDWEDDTYSNW
tara:strand:+ start:205 stop:759 length:555 start_codon:yes stop_codon:yes gene_type:complete